MGGLKSGRWGRRTSRATVEACLSIDAVRWQREGILQPGSCKAGSWSWADAATGNSVASIHYDLDTRDAAHPRVDLCYSFHGYAWEASQELRYTVQLEATGLHFGGQRWWFRCPLDGIGGHCGRRVRKLYLVGRYFGCRHCHRLTYASCQRAHQAERLKGRLGQIRRQFGIVGRRLASAQRRVERLAGRR